MTEQNPEPNPYAATEQSSDPDLGASKKERESHLRSFLKAFSWRIVATLTTILLAWIFTDDVSTALKIGGTEFFVKFAIYYAHERMWQVVPRGTIRGLVAQK